MLVSWLHWENLCNCNVYYADQGLQITTVHLCHPSCTLSVWQLALRFDSPVWCSSQHGRVYSPVSISGETVFNGYVTDLLWHLIAFLIAKVILVMWLPNTMDSVLAKQLYIALQAC